jgi:pimeloyl-ACP methyl ester carboxylesterase
MTMRKTEKNIEFNAPAADPGIKDEPERDLPAFPQPDVAAQPKNSLLQGDSNLVQIRTARVILDGNLEIPSGAASVVLFAHGSGSGRHSPRNRYVAHVLREGGLGTLLIDLLTQEEELVDMQSAHLRFDIPLLAERLTDATDWLTQHSVTRHLPIGYFGASTGSGAALMAAAERPGVVKVVVSRGGRPDLAGAALARLQIPVLLIVGGEDFPVIELNQEAMARMTGETTLEIIPGATHLFEEPGTLQEVAQLARQWFQHYLN